MSSVNKIVEKMKNQPHGIRLEEAEKVLAAHGYHYARRKGSHRSYINETGAVIVLIDPPTKAYIVDILTIIGEKK